MTQRALSLAAFTLGLAAPVASYALEAASDGQWGPEVVGLLLLVGVPFLTAVAFRHRPPALKLVTAAFPGFFCGGLLAYVLSEAAGAPNIGGLNASFRLAVASFLSIVAVGAFTVTWNVLKVRARRTEGPAA